MHINLFNFWVYVIVNDISDVLLVKKSKSCVILVYDGRIQFVTTAEELAQKQKQSGIKTDGIEVIKETFVPKNPFDILGKLMEMRNTRKAFLVGLSTYNIPNTCKCIWTR